MADELLDVVNDKDYIISREMRSVVHQRGLLHRGVHVFLFNSHNELLVQTRSQYSDTYPLALDCSVSEHVKAGETYRQAALRGLWEELGLQNISIKPVIKFKMEYGKDDLEICVLYVGQANFITVQYDPGEVQAVSFYQLEQLKGMLGTNLSAFSKWLAQLVYWVYGLPNKLQILRIFKGADLGGFLRGRELC